MDSILSGIQDLISNPFSTPVGKLLEKATAGDEPTEDWATFMEICDLINETEEGPRDGIRAVKKLLTNNVGKNNVVILYTVTVLETCVKNCGRRFHLQVAHRDFLNELIKIVSSRTNPQIVCDKILSALQVWADAFSGIEELREVGRVVQELKEKGIEFPMTDLDNVAPIHTPARSCAPVPSQQMSRDSKQPASSSSDGDFEEEQFEAITADVMAASYTDQPLAEAITLTEEQKVKLRSDLDIVARNCSVLGGMLTELTPGQESLDDWTLLQDLNRACQHMQHRIVGLIQQVQNEEVTSELLRLNDELNNALLRYDRYERLRSGQVSQGLDASAQPVGNTASLVDIGSTDCAVGSTDKFANSGEFDMFALSRESYEKDQQALRQQRSEYTKSADDEISGLGAAMNLKSTSDPYKPAVDIKNIQIDDEKELKEMEQWASATDSVAAKAPQAASSSEFDKFLATRAAATTTQTSNQNSVNQSEPQDVNGSGQRSTNRTINKGKDDDSMFSL